MCLCVLRDLSFGLFVGWCMCGFVGVFGGVILFFVGCLKMISLGVMVWVGSCGLDLLGVFGCFVYAIVQLGWA